jgi:hypothetical protein
MGSRYGERFVIGTDDGDVQPVPEGIDPMGREEFRRS